MADPSPFSEGPENGASVAVKKLGRPALPFEERAKNQPSSLTLDGPIPHWIGYKDLKHLIKLYRGSMYSEQNFAAWVEDGEVPSYIDTKAQGTAHVGVRRRKYRWPEVRAWIDQSMVRVPFRSERR